MQVLLAVLACLGCYSAMALECKFCMQYDGKSDNKDIQAGLDALKTIGNVNCKDNPGDDSVKSMTCPQAGSEMKAVCGIASIGTRLQIPNSELEMNLQLYMRMCQLVASSEKSGCSSADKYEKEIKEGMGAQADNLKGLDGEMCLCEGDNCNTNKASEPPQSAGSEVTKPVVLFTSLLLFLVHLLV